MSDYVQTKVDTGLLAMGFNVPHKVKGKEDRDTNILLRIVGVGSEKG